MKSKADQYDMKIWTFCENPSGYVWKSQVYTGQIASNPEKNQGRRVVLEFVPGLGPGYGVTCDNFFTSRDLIRELSKQKKTFLGTMKQFRKGVSKNMLPSKSKAVNSSLFSSTDNVTMGSYVPRKNRAVVLLPSQHLDQSVTESIQNKQIVIFEYNKNKSAVDRS